MWGRVTDAGTGKLISGATVSITGGPDAFRRSVEARALQSRDAAGAVIARPDQTRTAHDGLFYFLDLPDGDYTLNASIADMGNRYAAQEAKATVSRNEQGDLNRVFLDLALQATTVRGKITGPGHETGVPMAEVRVKNSRERTFSDAQGEYVLSAIEPIMPQNDATRAPGTEAVRGRSRITRRTVLVFAQGYQPASQEVALNKPGDQKTLDFRLVRG